MTAGKQASQGGRTTHVAVLLHCAPPMKLQGYVSRWWGLLMHGAVVYRTADLLSAGCHQDTHGHTHGYLLTC
jgi:hypothetical protein